MGMISTRSLRVAARSKLVRKRDVQPLEDYGFFGPGSVTWKVWGYPTSLTIGLQRAVVVEELDPALVAAVTKTQDIYNRPRTRHRGDPAVAGGSGLHRVMKVG